MPNKSLLSSTNEYLDRLISELNSIKEAIPNVASNPTLKALAETTVEKIKEVQKHIGSFQKELDNKLSEKERKQLRNILEK